MSAAHAREWQAMKQSQANPHLGTPEGAAFLAEAKRLGQLAECIEALEIKLADAKRGEREGWAYAKELEAEIARLNARVVPSTTQLTLDGKKIMFSKNNIDPKKALQDLSDRIRALRDSDVIFLPVSSYDYGNDVTIDAVKQIDGKTLWAARYLGRVLSRSGQWEHEPMQSRRTDEFLARCRFATPQEALDALRRFEAQSDD
jgi:hypothetical protein